MQLLFCPSTAMMRSRWPGAVERSTERAIWVAWPEKASRGPADLTGNGTGNHTCRSVGSTWRCVVDATWSGLTLARRLV